MWTKRDFFRRQNDGLRVSVGKQSFAGLVKQFGNLDKYKHRIEGAIRKSKNPVSGKDLVRNFRGLSTNGHKDCGPLVSEESLELWSTPKGVVFYA